MASSAQTAQLLLGVIVAIFTPSLVCAVTSDVESPQAVEALKTLKLQRTSVTLPQSAARPGKKKNFYSAKLNVGKPAQEFHVSFDLGGGTMVLPAQGCTDPACLERHRYNKSASDIAEDIQADGRLVEAGKRKSFLQRRDKGTLGLLSIDVGTGTVKGNFVRDQVCVQGDGDSQPRCFPLALLAANTMSDLPFLSEPYDGTVGLGLKGMSLSLEFNFLASFQRGYSSALPMSSFGLHIGGDEDGGEITFGGYDVKRLTHPLKWASVANPEEGRWQVAISAIRVGNHTLDACHDRACRAALDYSSSLLSAPSSLSAGLEAALARLSPPSGFGNGCEYASLPDIHIQLADDVTLTVPAEDFIDRLGAPKASTSSKSSCEPMLMHHDEEMPGRDVFILGEATLRRYYTFFDADSLQVGFSLAASSPKGIGALPAPLGSESKDKKAKKEGGNIIVLVQVQFKRSRTTSSVTL